MGYLPITDAGWLLAEDRDRPMHVGGLMLFRPPEDAGPTYVADSIAMAARAHTEVRPPFNLRLARPYGRAGLFQWQPDEVDLDYHFRHLALPEPGRIRELLALISLLHSTLLDRNRPLWESYLIEGIQGGRVAFYTKGHHAMLDGIAAMRQMLKGFTTDPDRRDLPPPWATLPEATTDRDGPDPAANPMAAALRLLGVAADEVGSAFGAARALADQFVKARKAAAEVVPFQAPRCLLNAKLSGARRVVAQSYDFDRIRAVGKAYGATVNDVVLTMCGSALRAYLLAHDALPDRPLIAAVPVSIRPSDGGDSGNALSFLLANLGTDVADPVDRLARVKDSMDRGKQRLEGMTQTELRDYGLLIMGPLLVGQMAGLGHRGRPMYNVVISNVPGHSEPLYWNGARMEGMYPVSLLPEGYALNITQTSYAGSMEFGITAARDQLPQIQRLIDHLEGALSDLEKAAA